MFVALYLAMIDDNSIVLVINLVTMMLCRCQALGADDHLVWDKDDDSAMDFVTACANIRAHVFGIAQKTRFDIKC